MDPHTPERPDGVPAVSTGTALAPPTWEVIDGELATAPANAPRRFHRYVWLPYRRWFFSLLVGLVLVGAAAGWAIQKYDPTEGTTYAGSVAIFMFWGAILACLVWPVTVVFAYWIRFWRVLTPKQRILLFTVVGAIPILWHFWWLLLFIGGGSAKTDQGWAGWKTLMLWQVLEHKRDQR